MHAYFYTVFVKGSKKINHITQFLSTGLNIIDHLLKKLSERSIFIFQWSLMQLSSEKRLTSARKTTLFFSSFKHCLHFWSFFYKNAKWQYSIMIELSHCLPKLFCLRIAYNLQTKGSTAVQFSSLYWPKSLLRSKQSSPPLLSSGCPGAQSS